MLVTIEDITLQIQVEVDIGIESYTCTCMRNIICIHSFGATGCVGNCGQRGKW